MIKIVTVLGTTRPGNYTAKALNIVHDELKKQEDIDLVMIDPAEYRLTFPGSKLESDNEKLQEILSSATGFVLATPEYHGTFSSILKLVIENMGFPSKFSGKPIALLGVAAGRIGAIKSLEHLRSVCSHVGGLVLPMPISIANVQKVFDEEGNCLDPGSEKAIRSVATSLIDYIKGHICPAITLEKMVREGNE